MIRTVRRVAASTVVATTAVVLAGATLASAHIQTDPPAVQSGTKATVGFVVEHGCADADTTGLDIKLPAGITDASATKDGWQVAVTDGVLRFSGGTLDHHTEGTFEVTFTAPANPGFVEFPTVQRCGTTEQPWLDPTVEGQAEPDHPAPRLQITAGPPTSDELTVPTDDDDDEAVSTTTASSKGDDDSHTGLWIAGAIIVVVVAAGAVAAAAARRRRSGSPPEAQG